MEEIESFIGGVSILTIMALVIWGIFSFMTYLNNNTEISAFYYANVVELAKSSTELKMIINEKYKDGKITMSEYDEIIEVETRLKMLDAIKTPD